MENTENFDLYAYKRAKKRVKKIKSFYINLVCYIIIIPLLAYINLTYSPQFYWFLFSAAGWGLAIVLNAMCAFNFAPILGRGWEERKMKELIEKERKNIWK